MEPIVAKPTRPLFCIINPKDPFFRRMRTKLGAPKAITATAHKLARILYHLLTTGQRYQESIFAEWKSNIANELYLVSIHKFKLSASD